MSGRWKLAVRDRLGGSIEMLAGTVGSGEKSVCAARLRAGSLQGPDSNPTATESGPVPGAKIRWPYLELKVELPTMRNDLRDDLAERLRAVVEDFMLEHRLYRGDGE